MDARQTPPRPPITFRVGVVGHRPDRLPQDNAGLDALRARLAEVLSAVAQAVTTFAAGPDAAFYQQGAHPLLRANSPLAEGSDRLFAQEALRLGYHLNCVMPFPQDQFETDFEQPHSLLAGSLEAFRNILGGAETIGALTRFELDGRRGRDQEAYQAAGQVVLSQSDLLVVVWDGGAPNGMGGTVDTLREAIAYHVPALWIDSRPPNGWRLLRSQDELDCLSDQGLCGVDPAADAAADAQLMREAIAQVVVGELGLPAGGREDLGEAETRAQLTAYLAEPKPRMNLAFAWKLFRDLVDSGRIRMPRLTTPDFVQQIAAEWPTRVDGAQPPPSPSRSWINERLRAYYAWSDKLADHYADAHRSGFIWSSLMAAATVFTALLPIAGRFSPRASVVTGIIEAVILSFMVALPILARRWRWHERWVDYRVLAELIRELRILAPLGGAKPLPRTSPHLASYGDPTLSWMYWQVRAIARATGLPSVRVTHGYIAEQIEALLTFIGTPARGEAPPTGQIGFYEMTAERMERIHRRLHRMSLILFTITLVAVGVDWGARVVDPSDADRVIEWLILVAAGFPALGAALASINNQGEFARLHRRARAMAQGLEEMRVRIVALAAHASPPSLASVTDLAVAISAMMVDENTEWRIVVIDLPHAAG